MANCPANPNYVNNVGSGTDTSIVCSLTASGSDYWPITESPVVTSNSHPIASRGDGALWDITAGAYVSIQNTNIGTTQVPKNGQ